MRINSKLGTPMTTSPVLNPSYIGGRLYYDHAFVYQIKRKPDRSHRCATSSSTNFWHIGTILGSVREQNPDYVNINLSVIGVKSCKEVYNVYK